MTEKNLNDKGCTYGKVTRTMLGALEKKFDTFYNNDFKEVKDRIEQVNSGIDEIKEKLAYPRPSWAVTAIITILTSTTTGLIILFLSKIG